VTESEWLKFTDEKGGTLLFGASSGAIIEVSPRKPSMLRILSANNLYRDVHGSIEVLALTLDATVVESTLPVGEERVRKVSPEDSLHLKGTTGS
jgi:hypothetical protein